jgi:hypothetical protein
MGDRKVLNASRFNLCKISWLNYYVLVFEDWQAHFPFMLHCRITGWTDMGQVEGASLSTGIQRGWEKHFHAVLGHFGALLQAWLPPACGLFMQSFLGFRCSEQVLVFILWIHAPVSTVETEHY